MDNKLFLSSYNILVNSELAKWEGSTAIIDGGFAQRLKTILLPLFALLDVILIDDGASCGFIIITE